MFPPQGEELEFRVLESTSSRTVVEVVIPEPAVLPIPVNGRALDAISVAGASPFGAPGEPMTVVAGTLIAVPPASGVSLKILEEEYEIRQGYELAPLSAVCGTGDDPIVFDEAAYARTDFLPGQSVAVGDPSIMRDFRVVPLRVYPIGYNPSTGELRVTTRLVVELDYAAPGRVNVKTTDRPPSRAFRPMYEDLIANYDAVRPRYENDNRGRYVIITHDSYYSSILPLAEWKHQRGMEVEIAKLSWIGSTTTAIKNYLQDAYDTWDVAPEYVLLVGDTEFLPTSSGDNYYAQLEGSDYLIDVHLGRLSCDTVADCDLIVAKTLGYERTPLMEDLDWFRSACLIVRQDYDEDDDIYFGDTWHAYGYMSHAGFAQIDTLFSRNGGNASQVHAAVTDGRVLVNYRGQGVLNWWSPFAVNPNSTYPGYKLPVVMSATCGTGSFWSDGYPCETWMRAGTVASPKGSVAFVATSGVACGVAYLRSAVNRGFFTALFGEKLYTVGAALTYAKYQLYITYPNQTEYNGWNCQGDPELDIWADVPAEATVTYPQTVPVGPSDFLVEVEAGGSPFGDALVCVYLDGVFYDAGYTNVAGQVTLQIEPTLPDTFLITVTGHNLHPYEGTSVVTPSGPYLVYESHEIDDSVGGNDDGLLSPGETVDFTVTLENIGPDGATGVTAILETSDTYADILDASASYGSIPSGASVPNGDPYRFSVDESCPNGHGLAFTFSATDAGEGSWEISIPALQVSAADLEQVSVVVDDSGSGGNGNGVLEAGETAWLEITIENTGPIDVDDVAALLTSNDPYVAVSDADGYFGQILSGQSASSATHSFRVSASPTAPPSQNASLVLAATGDGGTYQHSQDVGFTVTLGGVANEGPCGPDSYGYFAYDTSDTWTGQAPDYDWVEITGVGSIISAITNEDAATTARNLPFTFRYYGTDYTQVSICSNGFLAMGNEDYRFGDNSAIPNIHGPDAMVSPFWDDLSPNDSGNIYEWYDSANDRYVVQFDAVVHYTGGNPETFEVVFYDPAVYGTTTGDGIIVMQYQDVSLVSQSTIGIENPTQTDGIEYVYNNSYDPCAAPVTDGQAIRYTTEGPLAPPVWLVIAGSEIDDSAGGNGNGVAEPGETVDITLTIENRGLSTAPAVSATISTSDPDATIVTGTASFGSIAGGGMAANVSPLTVTIAAEPADATIEFDVHLATGLRYDSWDVLVLDIELDPSGIDGDDEVPVAFALRQNAPNPFRDGTVIAFDLPQPSRARLEVYNVAGRKVASVVDDEFAAGRHTARWDGRDSSGREVSAGIYFYRLEAGPNESMKKMILLK